MVEGPQVTWLPLCQSLETVPGLEESSPGHLVQVLGTGLQEQVGAQTGQTVAHPVAIATTTLTLRAKEC